MKKLFIIAALLGVATTCFADYQHHHGKHREDCHHGYCRRCRKDGKPVRCHHHWRHHHEHVEKN